MLKDMFKIHAALGGSSGQGGYYPPKAAERPEPEDADGPLFGPQGSDPDCRTYLEHAVTTMVWLQSHHLMQL